MWKTQHVDLTIKLSYFSMQRLWSAVSKEMVGYKDMPGAAKT